MQRMKVLELMQQIAARQGRSATIHETDVLRDVGFRSLDFSELALRIEQSHGRELNFDAARLRGIRTVSDVLDFFEDATAS